MHPLRPARPLPTVAHRPGAGPPPVIEPAVPGRPLSSDLWIFDDDHAHAADLFDGGFYWEAHEVWEGLWRATRDPQLRSLLQGLIQAAAALLHRRCGRIEALGTVAGRAERRLAAVGPAIVAGIDASALGRRLAEAVADPERPAPTLPRRVRSRDLPGCATDRWVQRSYVRYREAEGCLVVTTPAYPAYFDGHALMLDRAPRAEEVPSWLERCAERVGPQAEARQALCWEDEGEASGVEAERDVVLATRSAGAAPALPEGLAIRRARSDADWAALGRLAVEIGAEAWEPSIIESFYRWRMAAQRSAQGEDDRWWLVWDREELVAAAGLFARPEACRFQEVQTRRSHRRRGIASALVGHALADGLERFPGSTAVIVANAGSEAERIYRRLGFQPVGMQHWIRRRG